MVRMLVSNMKVIGHVSCVTRSQWVVRLSISFTALHADIACAWIHRAGSNEAFRAVKWLSCYKSHSI